MKKNIKIYQNGKYVDKEINYIPTRYIIAMLVTIFEVAAIIGFLVSLASFTIPVIDKSKEFKEKGNKSN